MAVMTKSSHHLLLLLLLMMMIIMCIRWSVVTWVSGSLEGALASNCGLGVGISTDMMPSCVIQRGLVMFWHPAVWRNSAGFGGGLLSIATPIIVSLWHVCPWSSLLSWITPLALMRPDHRTPKGRTSQTLLRVIFPAIYAADLEPAFIA